MANVRIENGKIVNTINGTDYIYVLTGWGKDAAAMIVKKEEASDVELRNALSENDKYTCGLAKELLEQVDSVAIKEPAQYYSKEDELLKKIREEIKLRNADSWNKACEVIVTILSRTEGAIDWLLNMKEKNGDNITVTKNVNFNVSDVLSMVINQRVEALRNVALNINLDDVKVELENIAWCTRL